MSLISIISKNAPQLLAQNDEQQDSEQQESTEIVQFDAILGDRFYCESEITGYTIESGARVNDHVVPQPEKYTMEVAVGDSDLSVSVLDFAGGLVSNLSDNPIVGAAAGYSKTLLSPDKEPRGGLVLQKLKSIKDAGLIFDINTGEILLKDMIIKSIDRPKTSEEELCMTATIEFVEFRTIDNIKQKDKTKTKSGTKESSQASEQKDKGEVAPKSASESSTAKVESLTS